jgi:hypothetical protein
MKNFLFTILTTLVLIGSQSCGKDTDEFIPVNTQIDTIQTVKKETDWIEDLLKISNLSTSMVPKLSIEKLMEDLAEDPTHNDFNAERGTKVTTTDNVTIEFPPNSCVKKNGNPCTGNLKLDVLVLRKKGEFLLNNVPTISNGKLLISGGTVLIKIKQDDEEVKLARNASYKIRFQPSAPTETNMNLFETKKEERFKFDWTFSPPNQNTNFPSLKPFFDSSSTRRLLGYELLLDTLSSTSWKNCARLSGDSINLTNKFCVVLPDSFNNQNSAVFAVFKESNSVVSLLGDGKVKQFCVQSGSKGLPIGKVVTIISISTIKERIYIGTKETTISANGSIRVEPRYTSKSDAKEIISKL